MLLTFQKLIPDHQAPTDKFITVETDHVRSYELEDGQGSIVPYRLRLTYTNGDFLHVYLALDAMGRNLARGRLDALIEALHGNGTLDTPAWYSGDDGATLSQLGAANPVTP